ncbi:unnamed protein product [Cylicocyclus nassatus]|uniref:C-type lectin domain-containing protein n=1 Tax=Cylicocyclus nassatus TaxID=53992 RepID=A0AA36H0S4_CYLNA|nr:unnamed protein product [Cylicocyclus nassatus]
MQLLLFALLPLAGGFPYAKKNEPIFRNLNQYPGFFYMNRSNAAHPGRCESGWTYYDETDACYKNFFNKPFQAAESLCISFGGHLTSIHSWKENLFVADLAKTGFTIPNWNWTTWIGLLVSDPLVISDVILWYQKWVDAECTINMRSFVCKKVALHDE